MSSQTSAGSPTKKTFNIGGLFCSDKSDPPSISVSRCKKNSPRRKGERQHFTKNSEVLAFFTSTTSNTRAAFFSYFSIRSSRKGRRVRLHRSARRRIRLDLKRVAGTPVPATSVCTERGSPSISLIAACIRILYGCCFLDANIEESGLGGSMLAQLSHFVHSACCGFLLLPLVSSL